jgi:hypothetical protein
MFKFLSKREEKELLDPMVFFYVTIIYSSLHKHTHTIDFLLFLVKEGAYQGQNGKGA